MRRTLALATALSAAASVLSAARPDTQFSPERFKAHVAFLADDALEGREAGTRGHEIAARYIAAQFAAMSVKPGGADGSYFEQVPLFESKVTGTPPTVSLTTPAGSQTLTQGGATVMRGPLSGGPVRIKAPVVFAGYGAADATLGIDDYEGLDVRGKIVALLWGFPNGMDSEIGAHLQSKRAQVASEHGAVAVISIQMPGAAIPWPALLRFIGEPVTTYVQENGTPFDPAYGLKAFAFIDEKASAALFAGSPQTLENVIAEATRPNGRPRGFETKAVAEIAVETRTRRYSSPEVIGVIEGRDHALKNEYVALMAHADHIGVNAEGAGDRINNGALDNAAGVATLLEVAHAFVTAIEAPRRSVLVIANTAEEKGLVGAEYFAHYPTVPSDRIVAAIDLDMPLLLYDFTDVVAFGATHSTLEKEFRKAGADMGVKLSPDPMPEQAIFVRSDHYAMVKAGVPAVMLATGMENGGKAAWDKFLSTNYHQPSDDLSQPIVWKAGAKFAELNYRVVQALADHEARPRWYAKDYFGDLYAPKAKKASR